MIAVVQIHGVDLLHPGTVKQRLHVFADFFQAFHGAHRTGFVLVVAPVHRQKQADQPGGGRAHTLHLSELLLTGLQHPVQPTEMIHQRVGNRVHILARNGMKQDVFQHLMIGKAIEAGLFKPLTHPLAVVCVNLLLRHSLFPVPFKVTLYALFFILYTIYRLLEREEPFE